MFVLYIYDFLKLSRGGNEKNGAYCEEQITEKISDMGKTVERVDIVLDVNKEMPLKQETREGQSKISSFAGRRRRTALEIWNYFPEATSCFVTY